METILTPHHTKYFAHDLTRRGSAGLERLSISLFDAAVDLNPHQIEAALFALQSPLSKGVVLADEVGLGKTIEAGIVLCQFWAERKRRFLVLCPASIRKQWALELTEKFHLPAAVFDAKAYRDAQRMGRAPLAAIGLTVRHIAASQTFSAKFERDSENRLRLTERLKQKDGGPYRFRTVAGPTPNRRKTLVIWRKRPGSETPEGVEQDNLVLDEWFTRQGYSSKVSEFGLIFVNGTNNLENLRAPDDTWKVRLIEEDFHRLMFATEGV